MVSNVIVDMLSGANLGLVKGKNLFAERSIGDQYVVVSITAPTGDAYLPNIRYGTIHVLVVGWDIKSGSALSDKICNLILQMEGSEHTFNNGSQTETYDLMSVAVRNWPSLVPNIDIVGFTMNIELSYMQINA